MNDENEKLPEKIKEISGKISSSVLKTFKNKFQKNILNENFSADMQDFVILSVAPTVLLMVNEQILKGINVSTKNKKMFTMICHALTAALNEVITDLEEK